MKITSHLQNGFIMWNIISTCGVICDSIIMYVIFRHDIFHKKSWVYNRRCTISEWSHLVKSRCWLRQRSIGSFVWEKSTPEIYCWKKHGLCNPEGMAMIFHLPQRSCNNLKSWHVGLDEWHRQGSTRMSLDGRNKHVPVHIAKRRE